MVIYLGIDPGVSGGWALLDPDGAVLLAMKMGDGPADIGKQPQTCKDRAFVVLQEPYRIHAMVERVHSSPQMGVASAFTFGRNVGAILGALAASGIPVDEIQPKAWQKIMGVVYPTRPKGDKTPRDKNVTKRRAQQLFPNLTVTHALADALLLAECARRIDRASTGTLPPIPRSR